MKKCPLDDIEWPEMSEPETERSALQQAGDEAEMRPRAIVVPAIESELLHASPSVDS